MSLTECVKAWRKTRHPRWAALAELYTPAGRPLVGAGKKQADLAAWQQLEQRADPDDLPRLFEALRGMASTRAAELLPRLALWNDPRGVTLLLRMLEAPPWRAKTATPFFRAAAKLLAETRDVRARDGLHALAQRYKSIIDSSMGDDVGNLLRRTAEQMTVAEPALHADDEARLATLEQGFAAQLSTAALQASTKQRSAKDDRALLDAIWDAPDDDAPRLVYADVLQERGDPRGELITLQVNRARGVFTAQSRAREYELLADEKRFVAWTAPLSQGGSCLLERGFPVHVSLNPRTLKSVVGERAWATVRAVRDVRQPAKLHVTKLLQMAALKDVGFVTPELLDAAGDRAAEWTSVGLVDVPDPAQLARLPRLERLEVAFAPRGVTLPAGLFAATPALVALTLPHGVAVTAEHWSSLPNLRELDVREPTSGLSSLRALRSLRVARTPAAAELAGLQLESLACDQLTAEKLSELLAAVPTLKSITMPNPLPAQLAPMLSAFVGSGLERLTDASRTWLNVGGALEVELRWWLPDWHTVLGKLEGLKVGKVTWRPNRREPDAPTATAPSAERLAPLAEQLSAYGTKLEAAWY